MRFILLLLLVFSVEQPALARGNDVSVSGHFTRNGTTYVEPHHRTSPDGNRFNNYSSKPNINPYTSKRGTIDPLRVRP